MEPVKTVITAPACRQLGPDQPVTPSDSHHQLGPDQTVRVGPSQVDRLRRSLHPAAQVAVTSRSRSHPNPTSQGSPRACRRSRHGCCTTRSGQQQGTGYHNDRRLYADALREVLGSAASGFVPYREHVNTLNGHTVIDRLHLEQARREVAGLRAQQHLDRAAHAAELAGRLREANHENAVPSRYRREGVELAAQWLESLARGETEYAGWASRRARGEVRSTAGHSSA